VSGPCPLHAEHAIRTFYPDHNMRSISIRRRITGNPRFKRGALLGYALEVLREADAALTAWGAPTPILKVITLARWAETSYRSGK
jgi:hypothetical protein